MKKISITIFIILTEFVGAKGQPEAIWQLYLDGTIIRWAYSGGDEFNGSQLDYSKWDDGYPWGRNLIGNIEQEYYKPGSDNISIDNGILKIITKFDPGYYTIETWHSGSDILSDGLPNNRYFPYTSGVIFSKQKFKYGLFEIRFKTPYGKGLWPAFWLYAGHDNDEIDVFEMKGEDPSKFKSGVVCDNDNDGTNDYGG